MKRITTNSEKETFEFGKSFAGQIERGQVVSLTGDLGAGKTIFVKGLAKALNIDEHILSPTFTLLRQYEGLNHFDVYRIDDESELYEIGFSEYLDDDNITIIEWANLIYDLMPIGTIYVDIRKTDNDNKREISVSDRPIGEEGLNYENISD